MPLRQRLADAWDQHEAVVGVDVARQARRIDARALHGAQPRDRGLHRRRARPAAHRSGRRPAAHLGLPARQRAALRHRARGPGRRRPPGPRRRGAHRLLPHDADGRRAGRRRHRVVERPRPHPALVEPAERSQQRRSRAAADDRDARRPGRLPPRVDGRIAGEPADPDRHDRHVRRRAARSRSSIAPCSRWSSSRSAPWLRASSSWPCSGTWLVRRNLEPLRRLAATATKVSQTPLDSGKVALAERVDPADTDTRTEVGQVGAAFNEMLDHVDEALNARHQSEQRVRQFVADASHELRTPLASIKGYAELSRREPDAVPADGDPRDGPHRVGGQPDELARRGPAPPRAPRRRPSPRGGPGRHVDARHQRGERRARGVSRATAGTSTCRPSRSR